MTDRTNPIARTVLAAQSDERLVRLLREGHEQAFDEIVRRYRGPLVGFAVAIVGHDRAEDVVQSGLEKAHRALLADDREINLRPWLFTIVRNGSLNLIRSEPITDELDPMLSALAGSDPELVAERNDEMNRLFTAICALPTAQREALVRRELEGVGHGEIASRLGTTSTAVRGLIFRARTQLRNAVGALVPLPVLRTLLTQGSVAGAAGGGAGAALFGGAGAKGGAAVAAAVLALGAGIAVEKRHGDREGAVAVAEAAKTGRGGGHAGGGRPTQSRSAASPGVRGGEGDGSGGSRGGRDSSSREPGPSSGSSGSGTSGSPGSNPASSGHSGSGDDHGGSGSGSDDGSGGSSAEPPEHDDDSATGGGSWGSGGHETLDQEDAPDSPEPPEVEEPEHDSTGPDDGAEEPDR